MSSLEQPPPLRSLRSRNPVLWLLVPWIIGLGLAKSVGGKWPVGMALAGAVVFLCVAYLCTKKPRAWAAAILGCLVLLAGTYYELRRARIPVWDALPVREAILTLRVERTFAVRDSKRVTGIGRIAAADTHLRELEGQRIYFSLQAERNGLVPPLVRSSQIKVVGLFQALPRDPPATTFEGYLANSGINFRLIRGRLRGIDSLPTPYYAFCQRMQDRFGAILSRGLEQRPHVASLFRAMLTGQLSELSDEQDRLFMQSGTMHLFSISGMHISVIALSLHGLLALLRLPAWPRYLCALLTLWLYVDITGAMPSAVRAFFMVALFETAWVLRLSTNPLATLSCSALVVLLVDPMQLFTASFQMSYGTVAALLLLGLPLAETWTTRWKLFRHLPEATWTRAHRALAQGHRALLAALAVGLATSLVSTVTSVIYFRVFTPGALLANLALIPVSSLVIIGGFYSLLCGLVGASIVSVLFNSAGALVLLGIEKSIGMFLQVPGVFWVAEFRWSWFGFAALCSMIGSLLAGYAMKWTRRSGGFWTPFALAVAIFAIGLTWR